ncbi:unnamed protein product [Peronospora effusa]|uniref:Uncharacterized protein n=1 Tax=Peronospora effusa TaxID=542832 RepID=A0A3M6VC54_9STRA|nr:hypothetical protein DD238_004860 [Peronospora effusa]CAI5700918.1 unnamed protein product [Peronospora effusa]
MRQHFGIGIGKEEEPDDDTKLEILGIKCSKRLTQSSKAYKLLTTRNSKAFFSSPLRHLRHHYTLIALSPT